MKLPPQSVEHYDPGKASGKHLAKHLADEFESHRADYLKNTKKHVPIANKTVRLQLLARTMKLFERQGDPVGLLKTLEQAAKEMGGSFTNQRQYTGKDGGAIKHEYSVQDMTQEQIRAELMTYGIDPDVIVVPGEKSKATVN